MGSFVKVVRGKKAVGTSAKPHPLILSLAYQILSRVAVGAYWGFEKAEIGKEKKTPVVVVRRVSEDEFAVSARGQGRELRLDLVNTALKVSDMLYQRHSDCPPTRTEVRR